MDNNIYLYIHIQIVSPPQKMKVICYYLVLDTVFFAMCLWVPYDEDVLEKKKNPICPANVLNMFAKKVNNRTLPKSMVVRYQEGQVHISLTGPNIPPDVKVKEL